MEDANVEEAIEAKDVELARTTAEAGQEATRAEPHATLSVCVPPCFSEPCVTSNQVAMYFARSSGCSLALIICGSVVNLFRL